MSIIIGGIGFVGIYYMTKKIVNDKQSDRLFGVLATIIGSLIIGLIIGVLKLLAGSYVAMNKKKSGKCIKILFLDPLTEDIVGYFDRAYSSTNNSFEFVDPTENKLDSSPVRKLR